MVRAAAPFAGLVFWLLAFPMNGFLQGANASPGNLAWFLGPHAAALFLTGRRAGGPGVDRLCPACGALALGITLLFPHLRDFGPWLLAATGAAAGPLMVRAGLRLLESRDPLGAGALALVGANAMLAGLGAMALPPTAGFALAGLALVPALVAGGPARPAAAAEDLPLGPLAFLFVFHLVSGISYGVLYPAYEALVPLPGAELAFYALAAAGAWRLGGRRPEGIVAGAVFLGAAAFALFEGGGGAATRASAFAMQASAGCMDVYVLGLVLRGPNPAKRIGYGLGSVCAGILAGQAVSGLVGPSRAAAAWGQGVLVVAAFVLWWERVARAPTTPAAPAPAEPAPALPGWLRARLSPQERECVGRVSTGSTFREVAQAMGISESTVKTYMKRGYEKAGVADKDGLVKLLDGAADQGAGTEGDPSPDAG